MQSFRSFSCRENPLTVGICRRNLMTTEGFSVTWAEHDTKEMVDRGKNEPSIIMWSIGNEIYDTTSASGVTIAKDLVHWVKEIDTTRPTTIGEDKTRGDKVNITPINEYIEEIFNVVDIVGLNYSENNYDGYHKLNPSGKSTELKLHRLHVQEVSTHIPILII